MTDTREVARRIAKVLHSAGWIMPSTASNPRSSTNIVSDLIAAELDKEQAGDAPKQFSCCPVCGGDPHHTGSCAVSADPAIPSDILVRMLTPPVCAMCGKSLPYPDDWFRCADCGQTFHQKCLQKHCKSDVATVSTLNEIMHNLGLEQKPDYPCEWFNKRAEAAESALCTANLGKEQASSTGDLVEALRPYIQHLSWCHKTRSIVHPCDCGLEAALLAAQEKKA